MSTPATPEHVSADQLADLHAGLLDPSESAILLRHIEACDECARLSDDVAAVPRILAEESGPIQMPADLATALDAAIGRAQTERAAGVSSLADRRSQAEDLRPRRRVARWLPAAAAAVLVVGIGAGAWHVAFDNASGGGSANAGSTNNRLPMNGAVGQAFGSRQAPIRLTPQNVDSVAESLTHTSGAMVGGSEPSPQSTFGASSPGPRSCPTPPLGVTKRVLWLGKPAVLNVDKATRTARVLGCSPAPHVLFTTRF